MPEQVRIGVIDSGFRPDQAAKVKAAAGFVVGEHGVQRTDATPDQLGHGGAILDVVSWGAPDAAFIVAQVFRERLAGSAAQVAAALDWVVGQGVQVVNLSLGLRMDREVLARACERALGAGVIVCASSPARGEAVFPAAYPGVFRMTGDARCRRGEISHLATQYADFGAHVRPLGNDSAGIGASAGCAHLSGAIGRFLCDGGSAVPVRIRSHLIDRASYHGPERRMC